jgi:UPF0755 protein
LLKFFQIFSSAWGTIRGKFFLVLIGLVLILAASAGYVKWQLDSAGPLQAEQIILVPEGVGMKSIARIFVDRGAIESPRIFVWAGRAMQVDRTIRAGEYRIPAHASLTRILGILRSGEVVLHKLTIPEGLTSYEIVRILEATPELTGKIIVPPAEGSLLPQTYYYILGNNRNDLLARMHKAMADYLVNMWPFRADDLPFKSPEEAVILASIVEKETGVSDERAHVAGVYINRIRLGMPLQADPTVSYGLAAGAVPNRALSHQDLLQSTPFNTYLFKGLPPTPIANPGGRAIDAVLHPLASKDLYFVADGTGGHRFAETIKDHNANVAHWRKIERERAPQPEPPAKIKPARKTKPVGKTGQKRAKKP